VKRKSYCTVQIWFIQAADILQQKKKLIEMKALKSFLVIVLSLMMLGETFAQPFLQRIYNVNGYNLGGYGNVHTTRRRPRTEKPRGRSYKDICRAINPAPYAFPNKIPYPSVPIC
jgi:hypothetical protein